VTSVAFAPSARELVFGRYRPLRPLGSGGSGSVWLALDERSGLDVALKIIPREGKAAARAEREAHAARRLRHDRCVRSYDVGHDSSHVYIAYEYVPGRTLREALRTGDVSDEEAVELAAQVLDALAHAHRAGIVHRDVKPSNILLEERDELAARLLDFGLAQFDGADTLTAVGDVPGTLAYIAPERLAGEDATPESDVWSVGVVLWEALSGRHPFWGVPLQEVAVAIAAGAPPLASERRDVPRRLLAAVDGALARDPSRRPRASALAADLRRSLRAAPSREPREKRQGVVADQRPLPRLVTRVAPVVLAMIAAGLGATLLPFWPPLLVAAIVVAAGIGAWLDPRIGLAVGLGALVFPLGNLAQGTAVAYGCLAVGLFLLSWRDARSGLLFVTGPLLAPLGLLALVPLLVQPARGALRRGAQATLAVFAAALVAGVDGADLPLAAGRASSLGIAPVDSEREVALAVWGELALHPVVLVGALVAASAAVAIPWARRWRYGVAAIGGALVVCAAATGAGPIALLVAGLAWALAANLPGKGAR
jgi:hypothetical protein